MSKRVKNSKERSLLPRVIRNDLTYMKTSSFHEWRWSRREHRQPMSEAMEILSSNHGPWNRSNQGVEKKEQRALRAFLHQFPGYKSLSLLSFFHPDIRISTSQVKSYSSFSYSPSSGNFLWVPFPAASLLRINKLTYPCQV